MNNNSVNEMSEYERANEASYHLQDRCKELLSFLGDCQETVSSLRIMFSNKGTYISVTSKRSRYFSTAFPK